MLGHQSKLYHDITMESIWINIRTALTIGFLIYYAGGFNVIKCELFTAVVNMEPLIKTYKQLRQSMDRYLEAENQRLQQIKGLSEQLLNMSFTSIKDPQTFVNNPVNIFHLIKWFIHDILPMVQLMNTTQIAELSKGKIYLKFPDKYDMLGIIKAIDRLQYMYNLQIPLLANGEVSLGAKSVNGLTSEECFLIGHHLLLLSLYDKSIQWFQESLDREEMDSESRFRIMGYMAYNFHMINDSNKEIEMLEKLNNQDLYNVEVQNEYQFYKDEEVVFNAEINISPDKVNSQTEIWKNYVKLCRNEDLVNPKIKRQLKCYYSNAKSPHLILQPIKTEDVHLGPWIAIYHNIITDHEIELLKKISIPQLKRANVIHNDGHAFAADYRISKSATLFDMEHPVIYKIKQRIQDITGLDTYSFELLQIVNYGIGGHYEPHLDFDTNFKHPFKTWKTPIGNRIATVLFYLSDVISGGATVFPVIGVNILPEKGSAVFWYNLLKTGYGDFKTGHAACPVLIGSKWVSNQWIHEYYQEFRRPCGLNISDIYEK